MTNFSKIALSTIALGTFAISGAAQAEDGAARIEVNATGYDLTSTHGVASLTEKVRMAAHRVCIVDNDRDIAVQAAQRACFKKAFEAASLQIERLRAQAGTSSQSLASNQVSGPVLTK